MANPLVSICCITYNHEQYIRDALEGFVMQQTSFPIEIVISDDCSNDSTRTIIEEYKEKYPDLIRDISPEKNKGMFANFMYVQQQARGKYIAICEGDDYWIDPYKLQKQFDYLEAHPDCSCCAHNTLRYNTDTSQIVLFNQRIFDVCDFFLGDFLAQGWFTATQTIFYRHSSFHCFSDNPKFVHGDYFVLLNVLLDENTYLHYDNQIMSVYRDGGWASTFFRDKQIQLCDDFIELLNYYKLKSNRHSDKNFDDLIAIQQQLKESYINPPQKKKYKSTFRKLRKVFRRFIQKS